MESPHSYSDDEIGRANSLRDSAFFGFAENHEYLVADQLVTQADQIAMGLPESEERSRILGANAHIIGRLGVLAACASVKEIANPYDMLTTAKENLDVASKWFEKANQQRQQQKPGDTRPDQWEVHLWTTRAQVEAGFGSRQKAIGYIIKAGLYGLVEESSDFIAHTEQASFKKRIMSRAKRCIGSLWAIKTVALRSISKEKAEASALSALKPRPNITQRMV